MIQLGRPFPEIARLQTVPGVGRIGAHLIVAYIQEPARFATAQQLYRYCRLGIRDRSSDGKPLGYQQLDRTGHGALKAISYRAWLMAMKCRAGVAHEFYEYSLTRTGSQLHERLNTRRKILNTLWALCAKAGSLNRNAFSETSLNPPRRPRAVSAARDRRALEARRRRGSGRLGETPTFGLERGDTSSLSWLVPRPATSPMTLDRAERQREERAP